VLEAAKTTMIIKNHNGATAVEFAIILPILILIVFGIIEFSLVLFNKHIITNASREGARAGIVSRPNRFVPGEDEVIVEDEVNSWLANNLITFGDIDEATVHVEIFDCTDPDADCPSVLTGSFHEFDEEGYTWINRCASFECPLKVTVRYDYDFLILSINMPFFGFGPITLDGTSEMRME
jgi:hypothetical protein